MSLAACITKHGAKLDMKELREMAAEYQADGMSPDTAMLRAASDKVVEFKAAQLTIIDLVRAEGEVRRTVEKKPEPAAPVAEPARTKNPKSMTLEELDAELVRVTDALADPYIEEETEAKLERRKTLVENQLLVKETEQAAAAGTRMTQKEIDAEAAIADEESIDFDEGQDSRTGVGKTDEKIKDSLTRATNGRQALAAIKPHGTHLEQMLAKWLEAIGVDGVRVEYLDEVHTLKSGAIALGHHNKGEVTIYRGGENARVVLHELFHAVTVKQLERVQDLLKLSVHERNALLAGSGELRGLLHAYQQIEQLMGEVNTTGMADTEFKDILEFVAEAMSDQRLQALMASTKSEQKPMAVSLWHKFVSAIKSMTQALLGAAARKRNTMQFAVDNSILARMLEATAEIVREGRYEPAGVYKVGDAPVEMQYSLAGPADIFKPQNHVRSLIEGLMEVPSKLASDPDGRKEQMERAKRAGREGVRKWSGVLSDGLDALRTMRGMGRDHPLFRKVQNTVSAMTRYKELINTHFNLMLSRFMDGMRRENDTITDTVVGMLESSGQVIDSTKEGFLDKVAKWAHLHMSGEKKMYEVLDPETDYPTLIKEYQDQVMLPLSAFEAGVFIPNQARTFKFPDGMSAADKDKAYSMYKSAMDGIVVGHLHHLQAAEKRATDSMEDGTPLAKKYRGKAYESIRGLRALAHEAYKKNSTIDAKKRRVQQLDPDMDKLFETIEETIYGLITGNEPLASANAKTVLREFGIDEAKAKELFAPLTAELNGMKPDDAKKRAGVMRDDAFSGTHAARISETVALRTAQELLMMYIPFRRHGKYVTTLKVVDEDGNNIDGYVTMPDGSKKETAAVLDVWMNDNLTMLNTMHEQLNKELSANDFKDGKVTVEVREYDEKAGKYAVGEDGKAVIKQVEARLMWSKPQRTNEFKSTIDRIGPTEFLTAAKVMGINLTPSQRERVVKASTNADSAVRNASLQRKNVPGYSTEFVRTISDHLGSVASMISIQRYNDELQTMVGKDTSWYWSPENQAELDAAREAVKIETNDARKLVLKKDLDILEDNYQRVNTADIPDIKENARKLVEFVLGSDQLEEGANFTNKIRAVVTILQLGGTLASPLTNLSSLPLHTFAYLATYNPKRAFGGGFGAAAATKAIQQAVRTMGPVLKQSALQIDPRRAVFIAEEYFKEKEEKARAADKQMFEGYHLRHWEFLRKAAGEGVLSAQKYNELLAQRKHSQFGPKTSKIVSHYMAIFAATEEFNRMVTGLAAFDLYLKENLAAVKPGESENDAVLKAYDQAIEAVFNTQGEYNQANRPMLFRSDLGALVGLYKTFIVTTLELISALPPKGKAYFLGALYAFSGAGGLPLWEELMVVLDVAAQKTGIGLGITKGNAERAFAEFARDIGEGMGIEGMDEVVMRGMLDVMLGTEIFGRAGVQVGLPGIGLLRAGSDFGQELEAATGAAGGAIKGVTKTVGKLAAGDIEGAARAVPITAVRNFADAYAYAKTGHVMNKRGQVVTKDVGVEDVLARMVGFYPSEMKWANDLVRREEYTKAFAKELSNAFIEEARELGVRGDSEGLRENAEQVRDHNANFKGTALEIKNYLDRRSKAIEDAKLTLRQRAQKSLSKSQQQDSQLPEN